VILDSKYISLKFIFNLNESGIFGGTLDSTHLQSKMPKPWNISGQSGRMNQSPTMMASRLMQNTPTEEDIKYWMGDPDDPESKGATFDPPYMLSYDRDPWIKEIDGYLSNMESLQELFGFKKTPPKIYASLIANRGKYQIYAQETLKKALVHKKFKEKIVKKGELSPERIRLIEKNEDNALNSLAKLKNETEKNIEFLRVYKDEFGIDYDFPLLVAAYGDILNKVDQILFAIRQATSIKGIEASNSELDEISSVGGGSIAGHIGPLGTDNKSPYLKDKKKKNNSLKMTFSGGL